MVALTVKVTRQYHVLAVNVFVSKFGCLHRKMNKVIQYFATTKKTAPRRQTPVIIMRIGVRAIFSGGGAQPIFGPPQKFGTPCPPPQKGRKS